jgi:hypothetical protein
MSYLVYQQQQPVVWPSRGPGPAKCKPPPPPEKETLRLNHNRWGWLRDSNDRDFEVGLSVIRRNRSLKRLDLSGLLWKQHGQTMPFHGPAGHPADRWGRPGGGGVPSPRTLRFLETLRAHSAIEEVVISQGHGHPLQPDVLCPLLRIPTLKRFHLPDGLSATTPSKEWTQLVQAIGDTNSLETLSLHNMDFGPSPTLQSSPVDRAGCCHSRLNSLLQAVQSLPRLTSLSLGCNNDAAVPATLDGDALISLGRIMTIQSSSTTSVMNNNNDNNVRHPSHLRSLELTGFQLSDNDLDLLGRAIDLESPPSTSPSTRRCRVTVEDLTLGTVVLDGGGRGLERLLRALLHPTSSLRRLVITGHPDEAAGAAAAARPPCRQESSDPSWEDVIPSLLQQNYQLEELRLPLCAGNERQRQVQQLVDVYLDLNRAGRRRSLRSPSTTQREWVSILGELSTTAAPGGRSLDVLYLALRENPRYLEGAGRLSVHDSENAP